MGEASGPNKAQAELWNEFGKTWVELQDVLDGMFLPLRARLVEAVAAAGGRTALDVGCGAGDTTLAIARALGPDSHATGIDISAPLVAQARRRAAAAGNVAFIEADAQTHAFDAGTFDVVASRLGVMFFEAPVAAFANLRRAARRGGGLAFIAWRGREANPFMTAADGPAASALKDFKTGLDDVPGQFGLASRARIETTLEQSGWTSVEIRPLDLACALPASHVAAYATRMGAYGRLRGTLDGALREEVDRAVIAAFSPFVAGGSARFTAACWLVTARA
ncbi:MAG: class I SAM-dependent methyltransferase [Hyphomicrobiaceae bacterium]|nr:class I SAM-dependent methyltransferase [Hyphomicrobiaceae bacterium]